jgi:hypothetical protein
MTKEEALEFKNRWEAVNERIWEEIRQKSLEEKLRDLVSLYHSARSFGWIEKVSVGEDEVRARWQLLREKWNERISTTG